MNNNTKSVELTYDEMKEICCALDERGDHFDDRGNTERAKRLYELSSKFMSIRREMLEEKGAER